MSISSAILWYAGNGSEDLALENLIGLFDAARSCRLASRPRPVAEHVNSKRRQFDPVYRGTH